jgi:hypothetical protein
MVRIATLTRRHHAYPPGIRQDIMPSYKNSEPRPAIMRGSPPEPRVPLEDWDRPPWNRWAFQHDASSRHSRSLARQGRRERPNVERFVYRSIETDVPGFCMERASNKRLRQLLSEFLLQSMGPAESACFTVDRAGFALADGGLNATCATRRALSK